MMNYSSMLIENIIISQVIYSPLHDHTIVLLTLYISLYVLIIICPVHVNLVM